MKMLKQRIAKAFGGGTSEKGTSNLEIVVWISVVLVIAVGLFFMRDNIAKFINNAATQIAGEESDGRNEYGFYFDKIYWSEEMGLGFVFHEDKSADCVDVNGSVILGFNPDEISYSNGMVIENGYNYNFSADGKTCTIWNGSILKLQE